MSDPAMSMPLFTKTFDFVAWLVPLTNHFPRVHQQTITRRLLDATLNFQEQILDANEVRGQQRLTFLRAASGQLNKIRQYLRLVHHWRWINPGQYEHAGRMIAELGRLLGGWQKVTT